MLYDSFQPFEMKNFVIKTCSVQSTVLESNKLNDDSLRYNHVLVPKSEKTAYPVVFILSGYGSDGLKNFGFKGFESNFVQEIDGWAESGVIPEAIYVFVNAWTKWGGSQFINSQGAGQYEDYIANELVATIKAELPASQDHNHWSVFGGSSGGYGALSLICNQPEKFKKAVCLSPDSFFQISLLPEIYKTYPYIRDLGGCKKIYDLYKNGELRLSSSMQFAMFNVIAMAHAYAPMDESHEPIFPIDEKGKLNLDIWEEWKKFDPLLFAASVIKNKGAYIYLSVGTKDEYGLQYGARQLSENLQKSLGNRFFYREYEGYHRDLSNDRFAALQWLQLTLQKS